MLAWRASSATPEKYDAVARSHKVFAEYGTGGAEFAYITREGFGWMNASFQVGRGLLETTGAAGPGGVDPPRVGGRAGAGGVRICRRLRQSHPSQKGIVLGMTHAMRVTMDSSGRLVVPKPIRERAGLRPGDALEISAEEGRLEIRIAPLEVEIVQGEDGLPLARAKEPVTPLTAEEVRETLEAVRARR